jgi:spore maturation protein A
MMNYIWAGLIVLSLVFALVSDVRDQVRDTYRNGQALSATVEFPDGYQSQARQVPVRVSLDPTVYRRHFGVDTAPETSYSGYMTQSEAGREVHFARDVALPEPLSAIREFTAKRDFELLARVDGLDDAPDSSAVVSMTFRPVQFVKLNAIAAAAFDFAETAVTISLGLIGVLALWLGLLKIGEAAGMIDSLVRVVQPILRPIFPEIPRGHPAMGMIALNMTANVLGLGNAATPLGIKAMEELQELNPEKDTATNSMVTLLALSTGSVQLVPPSLLVAVMGLQINQLIFGIIIATLISTTCGVIAAKALQRTRWYRKTDPHRPRDDDGAPGSAGETTDSHDIGDVMDSDDSQSTRLPEQEG